MSQLVTVIVNELASRREPIPLGFLIVLLHTATGIDFNSDILNPRDKEEARNYRVYGELVGFGDAKFVNASISGAFKPRDFIHPYEKHYSLPGYLDPLALSMFFSAADIWAQADWKQAGGVKQEYGKGFLSFIYMFFLLVHPFVDRNGRVARGLLDYYNKKLGLNLTSVWHSEDFKKGCTHKEAFRIFFEEEAKLPPLENLNHCDPYPINAELRPHLGRMADYMLDWAAEVSRALRRGQAAPWVTGDPFEKRKHVSRLKQAFRHQC